MNRNLYFTLACSNLKKNAKTYIPYFISAVFTIITFYALKSLATSEKIAVMHGGTTVQMTLNLGTSVIGFFAVVFLYYTNSFLMKQRKKELALYCILGLEKKHVARVLFYETLLTMGITLVSGLVLGTVICKLIFLILVNMVHFTTDLSFEPSLSAMITTIILFTIIFIAIFVKNYIQVKITNPIQLLKGGQVGEKEPKASWLFALIGVLTLGGGYYMAVTIQSPVAAMGFFFVAVILVIIGTNLLFIAGSLVILKAMKKNKKFYYKAKNFISVSGMIYRMKQNAVGLSNICILSTMVLVVLSSTISLYIGQKDIMNQMYPYDVNVRADLTTTDFDKLTQTVEQTLKDSNANVVNDSVYRYFSLYAQYADNGVMIDSDGVNFNMYNDRSITIDIIPLEDYNKSQKATESLSDNEILLFSTLSDYKKDTFMLGDYELKVKKNLQEFDNREQLKASLDPTIYLIVRDYDYAYDVYKKITGTEFESMLKSKCNYRVQLNLDNTKEDAVIIAANLRKNLDSQGIAFFMDSKQENVDEWYAIYGGLLFLGIFLGILFMMAAVLIIYYKQISEGYDDHDRFLIMQKVGLSNVEVKQTIQKQVLMVFFLPLAVAICHTCFALPMITKILAIFGLYNLGLINLCTAITIGLFALGYLIVYLVTAREYFKIVRA